MFKFPIGPKIGWSVYLPLIFFVVVSSMPAAMMVVIEVLNTWGVRIGPLADAGAHKLPSISDILLSPLIYALGVWPLPVAALASLLLAGRSERLSFACKAAALLTSVPVTLIGLFFYTLFVDEWFSTGFDAGQGVGFTIAFLLLSNAVIGPVAWTIGFIAGLSIRRSSQ